jgi:hypothetical protein
MIQAGPSRQEGLRLGQDEGFIGRLLIYCHIGNVSHRMKNHLYSGRIRNGTLQQPGMKTPCEWYEREVERGLYPSRWEGLAAVEDLWSDEKTDVERAVRDH